MVNWHCVKQCGACCQLDPSDRPDLEQYLPPDELELYLSMVGADGWCIHYDAEQRECTIYADRPRFCRVTPDTFQAMFEIDPAEFEPFAIDCCLQQIEGVYGWDSPEHQRFTAELQLADPSFSPADEGDD